MERYIALLRGVNVSGQHTLPMEAFRAGLAGLGYSEVRTCLNSGNAAFSTDAADGQNIVQAISMMLRTQFSLNVPVVVLPQAALTALLQRAPAWWGRGDAAVYDNLIFFVAPLTCAEVCAALGAPKAGFEQIDCADTGIFWSFDRRHYQETNWWHKTASMDISAFLTIRTANTVRKLALL